MRRPRRALLRRPRRLVVVGLLVLGLTSAGSTFTSTWATAQSPPPECVWEWGGQVENPPAECLVTGATTTTTSPPPTTTTTSPPATTTTTTVPADCSTPSLALSEAKTCEIAAQVDNWRAETLLGMALGVFLLAAGFMLRLWRS